MPGIEKSVMGRAEEQAIAGVQALGGRCLRPGDDVRGLKGGLQGQPAESAAAPVRGEQRMAEQDLRHPAVLDPPVDLGGFVRLGKEPLSQLLEGRARLGETERVGQLVPGVPVHEPVSLVQVIDVPGYEPLTREATPADNQDCQRRQLLAQAVILDDPQDVPNRPGMDTEVLS